MLRRAGGSVLAAVLLVSWGLVAIGADAAAAAPRVELEQQTVAPGGSVTVTLTGFAPREGIDLYVDRANAGVVAANKSGVAGPLGVEVPEDAVPGTHWVTAVGRLSGGSDRVKLAVRPATMTGWPQAGFDAGQSGYVTDDPWVDTSTFDSIETFWRAEAGYQTPRVVGDVVLVPCGQGGESCYGVTALDAWTGRELWRRDDVGDAAAAPGIAVLTGYDRAIGVDPRSGGESWRWTPPTWAGGLVGAAVIDGDSAFLVTTRWTGSEDRSYVFALNLGSGAVRWHSPVPGPVYDWVQSRLAADGGAVFVLTKQWPMNAVTALEADDGSVRWRAEGLKTEDFGSLAAAEGSVYVHAFGQQHGQGVVISWDAQTGGIQWRARGIGNWSMSGVSVTDTTVFASSVQWEGSSGSVHALDVGSGAVRWTVEDLRWPSGTSVVGDTVLVGNGNGTVLALDAATGTEQHSWMVGASPEGQPVVADGAIYVALQSREIVALRTPGPAAPGTTMLVPDRAVPLDEAHEVEATTEGWTLKASEGLGVASNVDVTSAVAIGDAIYVGTRAAPDQGGAEVWKGINEGFESIARFAGASSAEVVAFGGALYVLTVEHDGIGIYLAMGDERFALVSGAPTDGIDGTLFVAGNALVALVEGDEGVEAWRMPAGGSFASATVPGGAGKASLTYDRFGAGADGIDADGRLYIGLDGPRGGELWATTNGLAFTRVARGHALMPGAVAIEPALAFSGLLYAVVEHPDGAAVFTTADGSTFEPVPIDPQPRGAQGELAASGATVVFVTHDPDLRVLDGEEPLERARTRAFDTFVLGSSGFAPLEEPVSADLHDAAAGLVAAGDTILLSGSNFREGDAVWTSEDGLTWTPSFREEGTTPFTLGVRVVVLDGYAYLFHGDQESGVSIWRLEEPLVGAEAEGTASDWFWLVAGLAALLLLAGGTWWMARRRRGGGGPPEPLLAEEFEEAERIPTGVGRVK